jgi:hypothetical protein
LAKDLNLHDALRGYRAREAVKQALNLAPLSLPDPTPSRIAPNMPSPLFAEHSRTISPTWVSGWIPAIPATAPEIRSSLHSWGWSDEENGKLQLRSHAG